MIAYYSSPHSAVITFTESRTRDTVYSIVSRHTTDNMTSAEGYMLAIKDRELDLLKSCPDNWDGYGAPRPNNEALKNARNIMGILSKELGLLLNCHITPSAEGGVAYTFERKGKLADIEFDNDGTVYAGMSSPKEEPEVWEVDIKDIPSTLKKIRGYLGL